MQIIQETVPLDTMIDGWLCVHEMPLDSLMQRSHRYERAYLAWETVRRVRNPFFNTGTGFEGYFVGVYESSEEMLAQLLNIGRGMLTSHCRLYRHQHAFQSKLMKTLRGELNDLPAIRAWATLLGATLGKLHCNIYRHYQTYLFQNETYWAVNSLPFICYSQCQHHIQQSYSLAHFRGGFIAKPDLNLNLLNPSDYEAGLVVSLIGRFGHPILRAYLREVGMSDWCSK
jgi:hypothetical protein